MKTLIYSIIFLLSSEIVYRNVVEVDNCGGSTPVKYSALMTESVIEEFGDSAVQQYVKDFADSTSMLWKDGRRNIFTMRMRCRGNDTVLDVEVFKVDVYPWLELSSEQHRYFSDLFKCEDYLERIAHRFSSKIDTFSMAPSYAVGWAMPLVLQPQAIKTQLNMMKIRPESIFSGNNNFTGIDTIKIGCEYIINNCSFRNYQDSVFENKPLRIKDVKDAY